MYSAIPSALTGGDITTFDRSDVVFGETPEAQLKGRFRVIAQHTVTALVMVLLSSGILAGLQHHSLGVMDYMILGALGFIVVRSVKEVAAHAYARSQEKQNFNIEEETEETWYTLTEFVDEEAQALNASAAYFRESMRILLTRPEETSPNLESETEK